MTVSSSSSSRISLNYCRRRSRNISSDDKYTIALFVISILTLPRATERLFNVSGYTNYVTLDYYANSIGIAVCRPTVCHAELLRLICALRKNFDVI